MKDPRDTVSTAGKAVAGSADDMNTENNTERDLHSSGFRKWLGSGLIAGASLSLGVHAGNKRRTIHKKHNNFFIFIPLFPPASQILLFA